MNKEETLALFEQGHYAWNKWAGSMQFLRTRLQNDEAWIEGPDRNAWNEQTREWHAAATADFSEHVFENGVTFTHFQFPGRVNFGSATFKGSVNFRRSTFEGNASFVHTTFKGDVDFESATFEKEVIFLSVMFDEGLNFRTAMFKGYTVFRSSTFKEGAGFSGVSFEGNADFSNVIVKVGADFLSATFEKNAIFMSATFEGVAKFNQTKFETVATFSNAQFEGVANFHAMRGGRSFSLADALFLAVPDFTEANFEEAPRLDNLHIEPGRFAPFHVSRIRKFFRANPSAKARWRERRFRNWRFFVGDSDLAAKWRALKGLAVRGHDHEQELNFFRGELLAQRWLPGKRLRPLFWAGWAYQVFSDFGRSILRPFLWWLAGIAGFACLYLGKTPIFAATPGAGFLWGWEWAKSLPIGGIPKLLCVAGDGDPVTAAIQLSVQKALPFLGLGSTGKVNQVYACLYGVHGAESGPLSRGFIPVIPDFVAGIGVAQILYSTVMIFLFLLALRNHFRIK